MDGGESARSRVIVTAGRGNLCLIGFLPLTLVRLAWPGGVPALVGALPANERR